MHVSVCEDAAVHFGVPGAVVEACDELLPGLWRVVLAGGGLPHPTVFRGAWVAGERVTERGVAAFAAWARGVRLYEAASLEAWPIGQALEALDVFPPGFDAEAVASVFDPDTGERGGVRRDPLTVVALRVGYRTPGAAPDDDGDAPPTLGRATLVGTDDYRFEWTVEQRHPGVGWAPVPAPWGAAGARR